MMYRCLVLDHDDTTVDSTPSIHYPAHLDQMRSLRPDHPQLSLEEWIYVQFDMGFEAFMRNVMGVDDAEMAECARIWRSHVNQTMPDFFPGMQRLLRDFKDAGGTIAVVTHSEADVVRANYRAKVPDIVPDMIVGYSDGKNKPDPWPVEETRRRFGFEPKEILVVDDQRAGIDMANRAGVDSVGVGWSHAHPKIVSWMLANATYYLQTVGELRSLVLGGE